MVMAETEEAVICVHKESLLGHFGTCTLCGQKREYDFANTKAPPKLIKRGRINGLLTNVTPVLDGKPIYDGSTPVGPEPKPKDVVKKEDGNPPLFGTEKSYFDQHRDEILADRLVLGNGCTLTKWRISLAVWTELVKRWRKEGVIVEDLRHASRRLSPIEADGKIRAEKTPAVTVEVSEPLVVEKEIPKGNLPPFPPFNEDWPKEVKLEWLITYGVLAKLK